MIFLTSIKALLRRINASQNWSNKRAKLIISEINLSSIETANEKNFIKKKIRLTLWLWFRIKRMKYGTCK